MIPRQQKPYHSLRRYFLLPFAWIFVGIVAQGVVADDGSVRYEYFDVVSEEPVVSAYGILLVPPQEEDAPVRQPGLREARIRHLGDNRWRFEIQLARDDYRIGNKLAVVATTAEGGALPSEVRALGNAVTAVMVPSSCEEHPDSEDIRKLLALSEKDLNLLIAIRRDKRFVAEKRLRELLTPALLRKLHNLEDKLGLSYTSPLAGETPLAELAFRIGALDALRQQTRETEKQEPEQKARYQRSD